MRELPLSGDALLAAVSESMVALHERYHHRKPATVKTHLMGDELLACVMHGVYTEVEKTMIETQGQTIVHETRSAFLTAMQHRLVNEVENLSGRRVTDIITGNHVGPDVEIKLFILAPATA